MVLLYSAQIGGTSIPVTNSKTFGLSDVNSIQECSGSGQIILTIPTHANVPIPVGSRINCEIRSGRYEIVKQSGVNLNNLTLLPLEFVPIGTIVTLYKSATDTWDYRIRQSEQYKSLMYFTHWLSESDAQFTFTGNGSAATNGVVATFTSSTQPGILRTKTGSTAGGRAYAGTSLQAISGGATGRWYTSHLIRLGALSDATDRFIARIGFQGATGSADTAGAYWKYTDSLNSGLWQLVTHDGTLSTSFDTATTPSTSGWAELGVFYDFAGARILFYLDRALVHTAQSNIVTNVLTRFGAGVSMSKTAGSVDRELYTDYSIICGGWAI